jgi:glutamate-1-semialdehyde 2,1-aminomutase
MKFDWFRRANDSIAQGSLTNSKRLTTFIKGVTPSHATHGEGVYVFGTDGRKYIDMCCANGTNLFGYAHPLIRQAIGDQLKKGWLFSLGSTLEVECAELVKNYFPFIKKLRFLKNGSDACEAAVRIALAHTGRSKVLSAGYHGFGNQFVSLTPPAIGVPKQGHIETFTSLDQIKTDVACVILEPIQTDNSQKRHEWLTLVVEKCRKNGVLVIFDEIITGFRYPRLCFSTWYGLHPDIICLGKAAGQGLPLSIVGMADGIGNDKEWFVSATAAGEMLSLAVLKQTLTMLNGKYKLDELWLEGQAFLDNFNELAPELITIEGYPTRGVLKADPLTKALFMQETHKAGILFGPSWFFGFQHLGMRENIISACKDVLQRIKHKQVSLEGELPASPFAELQRRSA